MLDLLCVGGAIVDLFAEQTGVRLQDVVSFKKYVGSSAANIAVGVSRMGLKAGILSRIGNDPMGEYLKKELAAEGIDLSGLHTDPYRSTGLRLVQPTVIGKRPIMHYRENSADLALGRHDYSKMTFKDVRALLVTGVCCAKEQLYENTFYAIELAKEAGCKIVLDIEYKDILWKIESFEEGVSGIKDTVLERLRNLFEFSDVIVGTEDEILMATNQQTVGAAISYLREQTEALILQKRGNEGCIVYPHNLQTPVIELQFAVENGKKTDAEDAFLSGFLSGYLKGISVQDCCKLANACRSIMLSRRRCAQAMPYWEEVQSFMKSPDDRCAIERLHVSLRRKNGKGDLFLFAVDHRTYFQKFAAKNACTEQEISRCKELLFQAFLRVKEMRQHSRLGCLIDEQYGSSLLVSSVDNGVWTGRPIEAAGVFPLAFLQGDEASLILRTWPRQHAVKVLCYITDDEVQMALQIKKLQDLFVAAEQTERELLIGLNYQDKHLTAEHVLSAMESIYQAGVCPDWWNLPLFPEDEHWEKTAAVIDEQDPYCSGVIVLGSQESCGSLGADYRRAKQQCSLIKGCTCGRFLWGKLAERWLQGELDDDSFKEETVASFVEFIDTLTGETAFA